MQRILKTLFIASFFLVLPHFALASYGQYRTVTIDHTQVPNTDQASFPVLISGTYSYLAVVASGGKVQNTVTQSGGGLGITVPADVILTSDSACTTKLNWEFSSYVSTTGAVNIWVNVTSVSHTADTVIYLCYGNSAISTWQGNVHATWNSHFKTVLHMFDNAANTTVVDSTGNQSPVSANNTSGMAISGAFGGGGFTFNGTSDYVDYGTNPSVATGGVYTFSMWMKVANNSAGTSYMMDGAGNGESPRTLINAQNFGGSGAGALEFYDGNFHAVSGTGAVANNTWTSIAVTAASSVSTGYVSGSATTPTSTWNNQDPIFAADLTLGERLAHSGTPWAGNLQEFRISDVSRSADWIKTEYNNENSPSTFYTMGAETPTGGAVSVPRLVIRNGRLILGSFSNAGSGNATIAFDNYASMTDIGFNTSTSTSMTITGTNMYLLCFPSPSYSNSPVITSITYNGVSMAQISGSPITDGNPDSFYAYGLAAPATGSHTLTINMNPTSQFMSVNCASYSGVSQSSPVNTVTTSTHDAGGGASTNAKVTVTSSTGKMIVWGMTHDFFDNTFTYQGTTAATASNLTERGQIRNPQAAGQSTRVAIGDAAGAASVNAGWSLSKDVFWLIFGVELNPATTNVATFGGGRLIIH